MKIGFVHLGGQKGDGLRNCAIREYLIGKCMELVDIQLPLDIHSVTPFSYLTISNFGSFLNKCFGKKKLSLLKSISWNSELQQLKKHFLPIWISHILQKADSVDLFHSETHQAAYVCALVKQKCGIPFVFDVHGLLPEEMIQRNCPSKYVMFLRHLEEVAVNAADYISVVSVSMGKVIKERYNLKDDKLIIVPNGTSLYSGKARFSKSLRTIYAGNFAPYEKVEDFIRMADILKGKDYEFFLMGDGELRDSLFDLVNRLQINMKYLFKKNRKETLCWLCEMQVGVVPTTDDLVRQAASPIKVLDYASCGLPIITANVGEWAELVRCYDAGIITKKSDPTQFTEALIQLSDRAVWEQKSKNAKQMVRETCLWSDVLKPLGDLYDKM